MSRLRPAGEGWVNLKRKAGNKRESAEDWEGTRENHFTPVKPEQFVLCAQPAWTGYEKLKLNQERFGG